MPTIVPGQSRPGFQGSTHSGVRVTIYPHDDADPVILHSGGPIKGTIRLDGKRSTDPDPSLIAVTTNKVLGSASGSYSITLKPSRTSTTLLDQIRDDDWLDIEFLEHGKAFHVMRGLVDEIRGHRGVGGSGATTQDFVISGRDFGKVWEVTPVWFSPIAAESDLVSRAVSMEVFNDNPNVLGPPDVAVKGFFEGFLERTEQLAGVNWVPPKRVPGVIRGSFTDSIAWDVAFQNAPARNNFNRNYLAPNGTLWDLAVQHSDSMFTDLYVDVLPTTPSGTGGSRHPNIANRTPTEAKDTSMTVVFRDKPFPITDETRTLIPPNKRAGGAGWAFYQDAWDSLPVSVIPRQDIDVCDVGRSGVERYNAYYVTVRIIQEAFGENGQTLLSPLIDPASIKRHGLRRMDVQSSCLADLKTLDDGAMAHQQRYILRDWYCMNPYFLSGTISLKRGHPQIHIGGRIRIPGAAISRTEVVDDESYYVESVSHNWRFGSATNTSLGVTRGWIGTDASYRAMLAKVAAGYKVEPLMIERV